jgi:hypothetical protein
VRSRGLYAAAMPCLLWPAAALAVRLADSGVPCRRCLAEAQTHTGLDLARFKAVLCATDLNSMNVDVPVEF